MSTFFKRKLSKKGYDFNNCKLKKILAVLLNSKNNFSELKLELIYNCSSSLKRILKIENFQKEICSVAHVNVM